MYCSNCGADNDQNSTFCANCDNQIRTQTVTSFSTRLKKNRIIEVIGAIVVLIALLLCWKGVTDLRTPEETAALYYEAISTSDGQSYIALFHEDVIDYWLWNNGFSRNYFMEQIYDSLSGYSEFCNFKYEVIEVQNLTSTEMTTLKRAYNEMGIKISDAKSVLVSYSVQEIYSSDDYSIYSDSNRVFVVKIGLDWYLDTKYLRVY